MEKEHQHCCSWSNSWYWFWGGLLIQEVKSGKIKYKEFWRITNWNVAQCNRRYWLVSLMGANIFITLLLRCILTLLCVYLILKIFSNYSEDFGRNI